MKTEQFFFPHPQYDRPQEEFLRLSGVRASVIPASAREKGEAIRLAGRLRTGFALDACMSASGSAPRAIGINLELRKSIPEIRSHPEGFRLLVDPQGVRLEACAPAGLFYAVNALIDRLERRGGRWSIACGECRDWPDFPWRSLLIDPARKFIPPARIRRYLDWMAASRLNVLHVHFTDCEQFTIETPKWPMLNRRLYNHTACVHPLGGGQPFTFDEVARLEQEYAGVYSRDDIRSMVQYAQERHIQVVPEIGFPSHCAALLKTWPDLMCRTGGRPGGTSRSILCIGNANTFRRFQALIDEIVPMFPAPYVHIGADEIDTPVAPYCKRSWDRCEVCRAAMAKKGYTSVHDLFYDAMRRIRRMLAGHGKRMILWNDYIDIAKPVALPRDITIHFWRIADKEWPIGPIRGCSLAKFAQAGFPIINSHFPEAYIDGLMHDTRLASWSPDERPQMPKAVRARIQGSCMTAWGGRPEAYYQYTLPQAITFFGDRLWNRRPAPDFSSYARALARHLFGPWMHPDLAGVFEAMGSIIPPMKADTRTYPDDACTLPGRQTWTRADYRCLLRRIDVSLKDARVLNRDVLAEYRRTIVERTAQRNDRVN